MSFFSWPKSWCPVPASTSPSPEIPQSFPLHDGATASVSESEVDFFRRHGYLTLSGATLSSDQVTALRAAIFAAYRGVIDTPCAAPYDHEMYLDILNKAADMSFGPPRTKEEFGELKTAVSSWMQLAATKNVKPGPLCKINNGWWISTTARRLLFSGPGSVGEAIGAVAAELLGGVDEIRLWHDQFIVKPGLGASTGSCGWHQDYAYWRASSSPHMITALIQLQDTDVENGCLQTIQASHEFGLLDGEDASADDDDDDDDDDKCSGEEKGEKEENSTENASPVDPGFFRGAELDLLAQQYHQKLVRRAMKRNKNVSEDSFKLVFNRVKAGQITFHHSLTLHGSGPNTTSTPRVALALHMQSDRVRYDPAAAGTHHNVRDLGPAAKSGDAFVGPCFPVLWRRKE